MPRLWTSTIEAHRREVREAIIDSAARLVTEAGLLSVTMSRIAEEAGIGRATLYKYFPDVASILREWHDRQISHHLQELTEAAGQRGDPTERLESVLRAYAEMLHRTRGHDDREFAAVLHGDDQIDHAHSRLSNMIRDLLVEAAAAGGVRGDIAPRELAAFCLNALEAAGDFSSNAAVGRLVMLTMNGLRRASP